jgi:hypothetical protein
VAEILPEDAGVDRPEQPQAEPYLELQRQMQDRRRDLTQRRFLNPIPWPSTAASAPPASAA